MQLVLFSTVKSWFQKMIKFFFVKKKNHASYWITCVLVPESGTVFLHELSGVTASVTSIDYSTENTWIIVKLNEKRKSN